MEDGTIDLVAVDDDFVLCCDLDDLLEEGLGEDGTCWVVRVVYDDHLGVRLDERFQFVDGRDPVVLWFGFPEGDFSTKLFGYLVE